MAGKTLDVAEFLGLAVVRKDNGAAGAGTSTFALEDGLYQKVTCSAATRTIAAPTYRGAAVAAGTIPAGTILFIEVSNTSGGALTVTWNAAFKGAPVAPATANRRVYTFVWDGLNWVFLTDADVAN